MIDRVFEVALFLLAAAGVLFFGGVHPAFQSAHLVAALVFGAIYLGRALLQGKLTLALPLVVVPFLATLGLAFYQAESGLSIAPERTRETLVRYATAALVFLLTSSIAARSERADRRLAIGVAALVGFETLYGLAEHFGGREYILLWPKTYSGFVTGTYVNRNHFAGFLAIATPIVLAIALSQPSSWRRSIPSLRTRIAVAIDHPDFWKQILLLGAAFLGVLGAVASFSRGGTLALIFGFLGYVMLASPKRDRRTGGLVLVAFVLFGTLGIVAFGVGPLLSRFSDLQQDASGNISRAAFARATLALIAERPLTGWGLGTFQLAYPRVQTAWMERKVLDHAHCDVLEVPSELGIPAFLLVVGWIVLASLRAWRRAEGSRAILARGILGGLVAAAVHAFVDFDLELEGTLVFSAFCLGLLLGPAASKLELGGARARALAVMLVLALAAALPYPLRALAAERLAAPTVRREDDTREPGQRVADLEAAIALRPAVARYRAAVVMPRFEIYELGLEKSALAAAKRLAGDSPDESLVTALRNSLRVAHMDEEAAILSRSVADLRAARASEPTNAHVLGLLALLTPERGEAFELASEATRVFPFGADVLVDAGLARLRFDRRDAEGRADLGRGLALDPALLGEVVAERALAAGLEKELSRALPSAEAHSELASLLLSRGMLGAFGDELDAIVRLEEGSVPEPPNPPGNRSEELSRIRPGDWLSSPNGKPLEQLKALVLRLRGHPAFIKLDKSGTLLLETSLVPGHPPSHLCVLLDGKHLGHVLVREGWVTFAFAITNEGWLEISPSVLKHKIQGPVEEGMLVRDVAVVTSQ